MRRTGTAAMAYLSGTLAAAGTHEAEIGYEFIGLARAARRTFRIRRAFHLNFFEPAAAFFTDEFEYRHLKTPVKFSAEWRVYSGELRIFEFYKKR